LLARCLGIFLDEGSADEGGIHQLAAAAASGQRSPRSSISLPRLRPAVGDHPVAWPAASAAGELCKKKSSAALGAHAPHAPTDKDTNVPARNPERARWRNAPDIAR
jgi:hypothetical protein